MLIKEGEKIIIHNLSHDNNSTPITVDSDFELKENTIMLFDDYLCCTESIERKENNQIIINVYEQDAVIVKDEILYKSLSTAY